jgi:D-3-phosphoglycerate dehydrogenase
MTDQWQVLLPPEIDPAGPESIADFATCTGMDEYESVDAALDDIDRYDAVIVRVAPLDRDVIERADNLKVIAKHGSGLDNVDIDAASERNIVVCNTPGVNARSVAEHAIALLFGVRRNLHTADRHVRNGGWDRNDYRGRELDNDTLGLMGFGSIAKATAKMAEGIGLDIITYDPHHDMSIRDGVVRVKTLTELFERSDAVSLHVPLVDETREAVTTEQLEALGETGVLINTARGGVIDESALIDALNSGTIGGAGLDTFHDEPLSEDHPLCDHDRVLLTPHIGGVTVEALTRMSEGAAENVRTVYDGEIPESTVNREAIAGSIQ